MRERLLLSFISLTLFFSVFFFYLSKIPPTVYWQDSGIYFAAVKVLGVAYPPGFPLYIVLAKLFTIIFPFGDFTFRMYAFSSLLGGVFSVFLFLAFFFAFCNDFRFNLIRRREGKFKTAVLLSLLVAVASVFSYSLWAQFINVEVYGLHAFFVSLMLFLVVLLGQADGRQKGLLLFLLVGVWGLSFANHPMTVGLLPFFVWLYLKLKVFSNKKLFWGSVFVFVLCALIFYIYLPVRAQANPVLNWGNPDTFQRFLSHVTGREYLGQSGSLSFSWERTAELLRVLWEELYFGWIFAGAGVYFLLRKVRSLGGLIGLVGLGSLTLSFLYQKTTEFNFWLIPFFIVSYFFAGAGVYFLGGLLRRFIGAKRAGALGAGTLLLLSIFLYWVNNPYLDRKNYYTAEDFGRQILSSLKPNGVLFGIGDQVNSTVLYLQLVKGERVDVLLLRPDSLSLPWERETIHKRFPGLVLPDAGDADFNTRFVELNKVKVPIYFLTKSQIPLDPSWKFVPAGALWKLSEQEDEQIDLSLWDFRFHDRDYGSQPLKNEAEVRVADEKGNLVVKRTTYAQEMKNMQIQAFKSLGDWYFERGQYKEALDSYQRIFRTDPSFVFEPVFTRIGLSYYDLGEKERALEWLRRAYQINPRGVPVEYLQLLEPAK